MIIKLKSKINTILDQITNQNLPINIDMIFNDLHYDSRRYTREEKGSLEIV